MRAAFALAGILLAAASAAEAGDWADRAILGFSPDGGTFAFEEFGVQDGSGFPYSNIYIVDLAKDEWVGGSPFRVLLNDESASYERGAFDARVEAQGEAAKSIEQLGLHAPAQVLAMIGDGDPGKDGLSLRFARPGYFPGETFEEYQLTLEQFPLADSGDDLDCEELLGEQAKGFALSLTGEGLDVEVHRDEAVPGSRVCPSSYRIYAVVAPQYASGPGEMVAIVSVYQLGFEGPDRRFIAVPLAE